ncbi:alpha/beta fold hydrolase [Kitasatospora sp. NPDC096077]|uniref:alpha/beta fold hydrolase n=1 Tax=Kitasatospora sp. NPDC096077 TaxID=3155544 RepID=UPI00331F4DA0
MHWHRVPVTGQHYVDTGAGVPVLFLHGNPSWSYLWRHLLAELGSDFRCLAPDLPGLGLSPGRPLRSRPVDQFLGQLDALDALFRHLVADRGLPGRGWTLVMHDWGGPIGTAWARRTPGVVDRLVVLNTIGFRWPAEYRVPVYLRWIRDHKCVAALARATDALPRLAVRVGVTVPLGRAERRAYLLPYARRRDRRAVEFVRGIPHDDRDPTWRLLEPEGPDVLAGLPLFVGWGMRDPVFTPTLLREWTRRFPHAEVRRFPHAGHYVTEDVADRLGCHIRDFLQRERV